MLNVCTSIRVNKFIYPRAITRKGKKATAVGRVAFAHTNDKNKSDKTYTKRRRAVEGDAGGGGEEGGGRREHGEHPFPLVIMNLRDGDAP